MLAVRSSYDLAPKARKNLGMAATAENQSRGDALTSKQQGTQANKTAPSPVQNRATPWDVPPAPRKGLLLTGSPRLLADVTAHQGEGQD